MRIHLWLPDYGSGTGGIQTFSRLLFRALRALYPRAEFFIFCKNDRNRADAGITPPDRFTAFGDWSLPQRTPIWLWALFWAGLRHRPDLIVVTHANFTPVAIAPKTACGHSLSRCRARDRSSGNCRTSRPDPGSGRQISCWRSVSLPASGWQTLLRSPLIEFASCLTPSKRNSSSRPPKPAYLLKRYGLAKDQPVILTVARLERAERYKGYDQVLEALVAIRKQAPAVRYLIAGRGPDRARLIEVIRRLGVGRTCHPGRVCAGTRALRAL